MIENVTAVNIRMFGIKELFAKDVMLK